MVKGGISHFNVLSFFLLILFLVLWVQSSRFQPILKHTNLAINQIPITVYHTLKGIQDHKSLPTHLLGMSVFG